MGSGQHLVRPVVSEWRSCLRPWLPNPKRSRLAGVLLAVGQTPSPWPGPPTGRGRAAGCWDGGARRPGF